jgi:hypothetical protein
LQQLKKLGKFLGQLADPYIVAADFNMTPQQLEQTGFISKLSGTVIIAPEVLFTCTSGKGRLIDYFLVSQVLVPCIKWVRAVVDTPWRPHFGIELGITQVPRKELVHKHIKPIVFKPFAGPDLPWQHFIDKSWKFHGDNQWFYGKSKTTWRNKLYDLDVFQAEVLGHRYSIFSTAAEMVLSERMEPEETESKQMRRLGRGQHWRTTLVNAVRFCGGLLLECRRGQAYGV